MAKSEIVKMMVNGELQDAMVRTKANGEIACYCKGGRIFHFPAGINLKEAIKAHNEENSRVKLPPEPESEADLELAEFLGVTAEPVAEESEEEIAE